MPVQRSIPDWFSAAKLGLFIHWGPYSVPAWAPVTGSLDEIKSSGDWRAWFAANPYAEWYCNSIRIPGSPSNIHHRSTYGASFPYERFHEAFLASMERCNPAEWADLAMRAGCRYVVLTAKHHDGFLLWPSGRPNLRLSHGQARRDVPGELAAELRGRTIRLGLYYSGGLDWSFNDRTIRSLPDLLLAVPQSGEYAAYVEAHYRELIKRYRPSILWNDIAFPAAANLSALLNFYRAQVADGVVNDRFAPIDLGPEGSLRRRLTEAALRVAVPLLLALRPGAPPGSGGPAWGYRTLEYAAARRIRREKWETCRSLGLSFAYNQNETEKDLISSEQLIHLLADVVSKNGNLLLGIGPRADGSIPYGQSRRLLELGGWLARYGAAIYDTHPWTRAEGATDTGIPLRFTCAGETLYAILLGSSRASWITLAGLKPAANTAVRRLGRPEPLSWKRSSKGLQVLLPDRSLEAPASVLSISPLPESG